MRDASLKETGANAAIRAINAHLIGAAVQNGNAARDALTHESSN